MSNKHDNKAGNGNNSSDPLAFAERKWQDFLGDKGGGLVINPLRWGISINCHGYAEGLYSEEQMNSYMTKLIYVQRRGGLFGD